MLFITPYDGNHFPHRTVEAVIGYTYTGSIELVLESVDQIYLLAHNLECEGLLETCAEFLIAR